MQIFVCTHSLLLPCKSNKAGEPKQRLNIGNADTKWLHNAVRIMKITVVILLAACLQVSAAGYSQKITLYEKDADLETIFKKIEKSTKYKFLYMSELLRSTKKISISVRNANIEEVLSYCFKEQRKLDYEINGNTVIVKLRAVSDFEEKPYVILPEFPDLRGIILDENGAPAMGVNVSVKGTNKGTTTNRKGEFALPEVDKDAVLIITSIGYDRQEVQVKNRLFISLQLKIAIGNLDEMQVVAYGTTSKRFNTGNVATIKSVDIEKQPVNNVLLALQGRVPGLLITQANGIAGGSIKVRIQGQNSIAGGNEPLYVIDGVPFFSEVLPVTTVGNSILGTTNTNPLAYINTADIESIDVLKDADATSIYGSRAANGAILITTRKGKAGDTRVNVNFQTGWGKVANKLDLMDTDQYLAMRREAFKNDNVPIPSIITRPNDGNYDVNGLWDTTRNTDWQKELIGGAATVTKITAGVSGGASNMQYLVSGTYQRETSVFPGDFANKTGSLHFNLNSASANQKFKINFSGNYFVGKNLLPNTDLTSVATSLAPNAPALYDSIGNLNWAPRPSGASSWRDHPLAYLYRLYENKTSNLVSNAIVSYWILPGLEIKSSFGYTNLETHEFRGNLIDGEKPENRSNFQRIAIYSNSVGKSWVIEPQLNYRKHAVFGDLDVLIGTTFQRRTSSGEGFQGADYPTDESMRDKRAATTLLITGTVASEYKYSAGFAKVNYSYRNKYLINLTGRRDGSSRFGKSNQFHNFAAVGLGWIFSEEKFIQRNNSFLSFGKIRGSYGSTGSDQIGDYAFLSTYSSISSFLSPYQGVASISANAISNPYLAWEETKKIQFGLELGFFRDRIRATATYARNRCSNQLLLYNLPIIAGGSIPTNFPATVENTSWEFTLNTVNLAGKDFKWTSSINLTIPKNKLVSFPDLQTSSYNTTLIVGQPLNIFKQYQFLGVNAATGAFSFADAHGNPTSDDPGMDALNVITNYDPKFYGGLSNTIEFKNFQFDLFIQFHKQSIAYSPSVGLPGRFDGGKNNQPVSVLNHWQKTDDQSANQKYSQNFSVYFPFLYSKGSTLVNVDGSFIRLKNLSVSYNIPVNLTKKAFMQTCRIYAHCQNLFTITNFEGLDPESGSNMVLPPLRVITLGVQLTF
ncbi:SusC/RagA family TonB-linked outer membrane protein [Niastella sp. OAS944]|uniref:SusC/RagA family TonB-linked outer membrane protein n=1 Tax=Niastella sp. OAS944 TaxID=2664089 RepID=UPI00348F9F0A|nr:TonB-linked SusC/RagA family outer membrane protein [Chitinophagaceae bacterium OAS944]